MGYAIQRGDGTYRGWLGNQPTHPIEPGESIVELDECPKIGPPLVAEPPSARDQALTELLALDAKAVKPEDLPSIIERLQKVLQG